jgi:hypothetical protein
MKFIVSVLVVVGCLLAAFWILTAICQPFLLYMERWLEWRFLRKNYGPKIRRIGR